MTMWWWRYRTPASVSTPRRRTSSSALSTRPSPMAWAWGCRSVGRSSKRMADGCGRPRTRIMARHSISRCRRCNEIGFGPSLCQLGHPRHPAGSSLEGAGRGAATRRGHFGKNSQLPPPSCRSRSAWYRPIGMSPTGPVIYVVDDDKSVRDSLQRLLTSVGLTVEVFPSAQAFLSRPRPDAPGCLVLDVRLPGLSGLDLQRELARTDAPLPILFLTRHGDIPMSVRAMKAGAVEFLTKPFREQYLLDAIRQAIERDRDGRRERQELAPLRRPCDTPS